MSDRTPDPSLGYFDRLPIAAVVLAKAADDDPLLVVAAANPAAVQLLGPTVVGTPFAAAVNPELAAMCARVARTGEPAPADPMFVAPTGDAGRVMIVHAFPCGDGRVGLLLDDTGPRFYEAVLDCIPSIVFVKSAATGQYLHENTACEAQLGKPRTVAIGKTLADLLPPELAGPLEQADATVFAGRTQISFEEVMPSPQGPRDLHTTKRPLYQQDGAPRAIIGVSHDITDELADRRALARSREELDVTRTDLLATILELSTPVLPIDDGVLVVPLIGRLDDQRGKQFIDALLAGIQRHRAATVILDITGLELGATGPALLIQATRAAALLGAEAVLVGVTPATARMLVAIGTDFGALVTCADLQAGVAHARARRPATRRSGP